MSSRQRAAILVLLSAIAVAVLVRPFLSGLLGALVMTAVASPLYHRIRMRRHPRIAAVLIVVGAVVLVVAPVAVLLFIALDQLPEAVRWVGQIGLWERVATLHIGGAHVGGRMAEMGDAALSWLSRQMLTLAGSVISASINMVIAVYGLYYLML